MNKFLSRMKSYGRVICLVASVVLLLAATATTSARANELLVNPNFWKETNAAELADMLRSGADIHIVEAQYLWTPLHLAAGFASDPAIITLLLNQGANIHAVDLDGAHPLHTAAGFNTRDGILSLLLNRGADIEFQDANGFTPLHWAAANASSHVTAALLLSRGANIEARSKEGLTPLLAAAKFSSSEALLRLFWRKNGNIYAKGNDGLTILQHLDSNEALRGSRTHQSIEEQYRAGTGGG